MLDVVRFSWTRYSSDFISYSSYTVNNSVWEEVLDSIQAFASKYNNLMAECVLLSSASKARTP